MILGLLAGNTSLRYGLHASGTIQTWGRIEWGELQAEGWKLAALVEGRAGLECVAGSVRDDMLARVEPLLPRGLWPPLLVRRDFAIPIENRYERPEDAGTDRLLNALAVKEMACGRAAVAVDFGTAVSVSVVAKDGAFIGGAIGAGGRAVAQGLKAAAPRLPLASVGPSKSFIQACTEDAVRCGVFWQVAGGVGALLRGILGELGPDGARVVATGGEAPLFAPVLPEIDETVPELTLRGLFLACEARR